MEECLLAIDESFAIANRTHYEAIDIVTLLDLAGRFGAISAALFHADFYRFRDTEAVLIARAYGIMTIHVPSYRNGGGLKSETDQALFADVEKVLALAPAIKTVLLAVGDGHFLYYAQILKAQGYRVIFIGLSSATHWRLKLKNAGWEYVEFTPPLVNEGQAHLIEASLDEKGITTSRVSTASCQESEPPEGNGDTHLSETCVRRALASLLQAECAYGPEIQLAPFFKNYITPAFPHLSDEQRTDLIKKLTREGITMIGYAEGPEKRRAVIRVNHSHPWLQDVGG